MEQPITTEPSREAAILNQMQSVADRLTGWLKFLGIVSIISGALSVLSIWGIVIAWLPIWMGVLLLQASSKIASSRMTTNRGELVSMLDKLRLYFLINGVLIIASVAIALLVIIIFGSLIMKYISGGGLDSFDY